MFCQKKVLINSSNNRPVFELKLIFHEIPVNWKIVHFVLRDVLYFFNERLFPFYIGIANSCRWIELGWGSIQRLEKETG